MSRILATLDGRRTRPSPAYGYGLLDGYRAVTATVPIAAPNPVFRAVAPFLARDAALAKVAAPVPPPPAVGRTKSTGSYVVGSAPRFAGKVVTGLTLAGAGGLLLLTLLYGGLRSRRRRRIALSAAVSDGRPG
jgi:hypothetical protein